MAAGQVGPTRPVSVNAVVTLPGPVRGVLDPWGTGPVVAELSRRRAATVAGLAGTVLEVNGPPGVAPRIPDGATFDHIVSTAWLAAADDLDAEVARLVTHLGDGGWLHVLEPTIGVGATARAQRLAATVGVRRTGWRLDRDIPGAIRGAGLVITDLERFSMHVPSVVLQPWVAARARRRGPVPFAEALS